MLVTMISSAMDVIVLVLRFDDQLLLFTGGSLKCGSELSYVCDS